MSTVVISTPAATGRPFVFDGEADLEVRPWTDGPAPEFVPEWSAVRFQSAIKTQPSTISPGSVTPASHLAIRPAPEIVPSGIPALDALTGGLPRGCLTEICGPASSGRTTVLLAALAAATRRGEFCAVVDASDALDPQSVGAAGIELQRMLWVRCRDLEQVLRATDLLLESGGFGLIVLDLGDLPPQSARRIPLTTWFRFRRAVEHKPTILVAIEQQAIAGSCSSLLLQLGVPGTQYLAPSSENMRPAHAHLLTGVEIKVELIHSRLERKPARSVTFATKTAWAG